MSIRFHLEKQRFKTIITIVGYGSRNNIITHFGKRLLNGYVNMIHPHLEVLRKKNFFEGNLEILK